MTAKQTAAALEAAVAAALTARETCDPADRGECRRLDAEVLAAQNALALQFHRAAHACARRLLKRYPLVDYDELAAECMLGVVKAARDWRPGRGNSFATHAHVGAWYAGLSWGPRANHAGFTGLSRFPTLRPHFVREVTAPDGETAPAVGGLTAPEVEPPDLTAGELDALLSGLTERERLVLRACVCERRTLDDAGRALGVSKERVRQVKVAALAKLRERVATHGEG